MSPGQEALGSRTGVGRGEKAVGDGGRWEEECVCEAEGTGKAQRVPFKLHPVPPRIPSLCSNQCG